MWGYAVSAIIGGLLGWWMWKNHKNGRSDKIAQIPYAGPVMDYKSWMPHNNHDWNIIIGKSMVAVYILLAFMTYSFLLVFVPVLVLYHFEWKTE